MRSSHTLRLLSLTSALLLSFAHVAGAGTLVYTPINPNFGGNPLNGSLLLNQAQAQNQFTQSNSGSSAGAQTQSPGQIFAQELTSQLYASLANQITTAIFGQNAAQSGTFSFQGTTINFQHVGGNIEISINDGSTITNVTVPATSE
jgi:curli production assembly/transport component CsgF